MSRDKEFWNNYDRYRKNILKGFSQDMHVEPLDKTRRTAAKLTALEASMVKIMEENTKILEVVSEFLNEREEFISTLKQCVNADADYYRWQGHAEARRVLADRVKALEPSGRGE